MASSSSQLVVVSIEYFEKDKKVSKISNKIERVQHGDSFHEIFDKLKEKHDIGLVENLKVFISSETTRKNEIEVESSETFVFASELMTVKSIYFLYTNKTIEIDEPTEPKRCAFELMMRPTTQTLHIMSGSDKKVKLHNDVLSDLQSFGPILHGRTPPSEGERILKMVTDAIWYLDGRKETINEASRKRKVGAILPTPDRLAKYSGYQDWKKWKKKPRLEASECDIHAQSLISAVENGAIAWPSDWKDDIVALSSSLSSYSKELKSAKEAQNSRQSSLHPVRQLQENATGQYWPSIERDKVSPKLKFLSDFVEVCAEFEPFLVEEEHFEEGISHSEIYNALRNIALAAPVQIVRYDSGGGASILIFIQKVPALFTEDEKLTRFMRMLRIIEPQVPVYHTRAMRKKFAKEIGSLHSTDLKPHVIRHIYRTLTGDSSNEVNCAEIDARVRLAVETNDPDLILDLRHLNKGRPGDTFDLFFKELALVVEQITAADERRHGISHMSEFISIRDLIARVRDKLPEGTPIPSESTIIHSFAPPNIHAKTAQYYTGKINLKFVVQRRQLRAFHADAHWNNALYLYFRQLCIHRREGAVFVSCDDKAKVDFGEPGSVISSGVRGKKSIVPVTTTLGALDHDVNQKGSIIPTVSLIVDIPDDIESSFYRGQVSMSLKESVFQPSDSYRSILELMKAFEHHEIDWGDKKQLFMVTDGGPEHRVNFESVKIPLIMMFKKLNLDFLVAIRTAPGHSYINIVERIMSILNLGFQNVALQRGESPSDTIIDKCKTLAELRKKPEIKEDWQESVKPLTVLLGERVERLQLKDVPFKIIPAATDEELDEFIEDTSEIDEQLPSRKRDGKLAKPDVKDCNEYQSFLSNHCVSCHYSFQIRRCKDSNCCLGEYVEVPWLPHPAPEPLNPGHYKKFEDAYAEGITPTDEHIPSFLNNVRRVAEEVQGCKSSTLTAQNVRSTVPCRICKKIGCIYAKRQLTNRELKELKRVITDYDYICGCVIAPEDSFLVGTIFSRLELHCGAPMEFMYYSATKINVHRDLCVHCGKARATIDQALKKSYKSVLPICDICRSRGKEPITKGHLKTAAANKSNSGKK